MVIPFEQAVVKNPFEGTQALSKALERLHIWNLQLQGKAGAFIRIENFDDKEKYLEKSKERTLEAIKRAFQDMLRERIGQFIKIFDNSLDALDKLEAAIDHEIGHAIEDGNQALADELLDFKNDVKDLKEETKKKRTWFKKTIESDEDIDEATFNAIEDDVEEHTTKTGNLFTRFVGTMKNAYKARFAAATATAAASADVEGANTAYDTQNPNADYSEAMNHFYESFGNDESDQSDRAQTEEETETFSPHVS